MHAEVMDAAYKFVHPGTVKQGYLVKSPPLDKKIKLDGWRKRWCVFTITEQDPSLDYYKDEEDALSTLPIKRISLINCYQVVSDMKHKQKKHIFALHLPERVYYFSAQSHVEMLEWVEAFCTNLNLSHTNGGTLPSTPPMSRPDDVRKSMTMPASRPMIRAPGSPLPPIPTSQHTPPIPRSPELGRPKPPAIPVPPTPLDVYPSVSPSTSPLLMARSIPLSNTRGEENGLTSHSEGAKVVVSVDEPPPAPPPHRVLKSAKSSSDEDDEEPLSPPLPPPRRVSPVPSSPPMSPPFEMDGDYPPTPPPRPVTDSPSHSVLVTTD